MTELGRVLDVFESLGYPREVVTQWSLPQGDVTDLVRLATESNASRVLEVGSFVGTSAFLMAKALPKACVHSVDPNLPLQVEFQAMGADGHRANLNRRTLEIAGMAAERLSLSHRVRFHAGGFAVGSSFALTDVEVPIVGPQICREHGPFGFIFIDGLHFEEAVVQDLLLALPALSTDGVLALHDVIGYWGSHVRRAVARILESEAHGSDLCFFHAPYRTISRAIGTLQRRGRPAVPLPTRLDAAFGDSTGLATHLARLLRSILGSVRFEPRDAFASAIASCLPATEDGAPRVVIAMDAIDGVPASLQPRVLAELSEGADAILLGLTPPGEEGAASNWSRPLSTRVKMLEKLGFATYDLVFPFLEPYTHAFGRGAAVDRKTSFLMDTVIAVRREGRLFPRVAHETALDPETARARVDGRLQVFFAACCLAKATADFASGRKSLQAELQAQENRLERWIRHRIHFGRYHFWRRR